jgi:hypothetical protein
MAWHMGKHSEAARPFTSAEIRQQFVEVLSLLRFRSLRARLIEIQAFIGVSAFAILLDAGWKDALAIGLVVWGACLLIQIAMSRMEEKRMVRVICENARHSGFGVPSQEASIRLVIFFDELMWGVSRPDKAEGVSG